MAREQIPTETNDRWMTWRNKRQGFKASRSIIAQKAAMWDNLKEEDHITLPSQSLIDYTPRLVVPAGGSVDRLLQSTEQLAYIDRLHANANLVVEGYIQEATAALANKTGSKGEKYWVGGKRLFGRHNSSLARIPYTLSWPKPHEPQDIVMGKSRLRYTTEVEFDARIAQEEEPIPGEELFAHMKKVEGTITDFDTSPFQSPVRVGLSFTAENQVESMTIGWNGPLRKIVGIDGFIDYPKYENKYVISALEYASHYMLRGNDELRTFLLYNFAIDAMGMDKPAEWQEKVNYTQFFGSEQPRPFTFRNDGSLLPEAEIKVIFGEDPTIITRQTIIETTNRLPRQKIPLRSEYHYSSKDKKWIRYFENLAAGPEAIQAMRGQYGMYVLTPLHMGADSVTGLTNVTQNPPESLTEDAGEHVITKLFALLPHLPAFTSH